jgi:hypothetical protein
MCDADRLTTRQAAGRSFGHPVEANEPGGQNVARNFSNIVCAIWKDPDFRALPGSMQRTYMMLFSQQDISAAGVLAVTLSRWARYAADTTVESITADIGALVDARYLVVDADTDELLVRSFIKWDKGYRNPKRRPVLLEAIAQVQSPLIRAAIDVELARLDATPSGVERAAKPQANTLFDTPSDDLSDRQSQKTGQSNGAYLTPHTTNHKPQTDSLRSSGTTAKISPSKGSRLPDDFAITDDMREWARAKAPRCGVTDHEAFVDYFRAAPGAKGVKLDWPATWRNWMRKAEESRWRGNGRPPGPRPSTTDEAVAQTLRLAEDLDPTRTPPRRAIAG